MFGKIFQSMYTGSMCGAGTDIFAVWTWILAHSDQDGCLEINPVIVACVLGADVDTVKKAVESLQDKDPASRSKTLNGRRLEHIDGFLFHVVNHQKYRDIRKEEDRRIQNRDAKRRSRSKTKDSQHPVSTGQQPSSMSAQTEGETEGETEGDNRTKNTWLDFVKLTCAEHEKLVSKLEEKTCQEYIERLNNYIGSKGKKYKSHYHTILNWYNKDQKENKGGTEAKSEEFKARTNDFVNKGLLPEDCRI